MIKIKQRAQNKDYETHEKASHSKSQRKQEPTDLDYELIILYRYRCIDSVYIYFLSLSTERA